VELTKGKRASFSKRKRRGGKEDRMHPLLVEEIGKERHAARIHDASRQRLAGRAARAKAAEVAPPTERRPGNDGEPITIRPLTPGDGTALAGLAQRDSRRTPPEPLLGAEADGALVAAISIADGRVVADPFRPTADAVELLRLRARHLRQDPAPEGRLARLGRALGGRRRRASGALGGSPPGAGGRLLVLLERGHR
jgi:hypothetical protein